MSLLEAILMGLIQGLTEFLPVSSSGHLAIFKNLFGLQEVGLLFDVLLHIGTLIAVFIVYWKDIWKMIVAGIGIVIDACKNIGIFFANCTKKGEEKRAYRKVISSGYRKFAMLIIVSTIPTGIIGILDKNLVELGSQILLIPALCLIATAVLLLIADHCKGGEKLPNQVSYSNGFVIGIAQGIATLPGLSRSGTTITACLLSGFQKKFAVKYSFIMSIPAILGSLVLELSEIDTKAVTSSELVCYLVGMLVAAVVGYICIKLMLYVVKEKKFTGFAIYCAIIGTISLGVYLYQL